MQGGGESWYEKWRRPKLDGDEGETPYLFYSQVYGKKGSINEEKTKLVSEEKKEKEKKKKKKARVPRLWNVAQHRLFHYDAGFGHDRNEQSGND